MTDDFSRQIEEFQAAWSAMTDQVGKVIVGQTEVIAQTLTCLLSGGHVLLEGVPGLGKTLLVRTIGQALDLSFRRIQFTPDLMPADITGTNIVVADAAGQKAFRFQGGPIFAHLVLADEINRATPKTQSAVLEAMGEQTVSVSRTTHELPQPFFVLATQNPLEMEGTYPLPEAQLDRFQFKVLVGTPDVGELSTILERTTGAEITRAEPVADAAQFLQLRQTARRVTVASHVTEHISRLVLATHPTRDGAPDIVRRYVRYGASPRGAQAILLAAKVGALCDGRANVSFDDVEAVAAPALRHRLILSFEGQADGADADEIVRQALRAVGRPKPN